MSVLDGKNVVLGVTGGIAAYKSAELCRLLRKAGARVQVVMTDAACEFITPLTMQALSGEPVARGLFDLAGDARRATTPGSTGSEIGHIELADRADLILIAPATADAIARMAAGMADDLLTAVVLASRAPLLLAPAMNVNMWTSPLTQANLARLMALGRVSTVGPDAGELACGWVGAGRLVDPAEILEAAERILGPRDLDGRQVVVTAGPTHEPIDDVRFIANRSSGKMGFALARAAARRGAAVTLIAGPVALATPGGIARRIDVETAAEMRQALREVVRAADALVMAAAVGDFRPAARARGKLDRRSDVSSVGLRANPDLLSELGRTRRGGRPLLVGFAAETGAPGEALAERARRKLKDKRCDVVVANDVSVEGIGFGGDRNALTLVYADGRTEVLPPASKQDLAEVLWDRLVPLLAATERRRLPQAGSPRHG